jgi:hypothetical protein
MAPIAHWPGPGGCQGTFDFPAGRVGGFEVLHLVHGTAAPARGATGAGFGLPHFDWRTCTCALRSWPSATVAEAHAGIAFAKPDFGYNKR